MCCPPTDYPTSFASSDAPIRDLVTYPSGLTGHIRGMNIREGGVLADRTFAKQGGRMDKLLTSCWEETLAPGPTPSPRARGSNGASSE